MTKSLLQLDCRALWEPSLTVWQPVLHRHDVSLWNQLVAELRFVVGLRICIDSCHVYLPFMLFQYFVCNA